jgi:PKD repeat protein
MRRSLTRRTQQDRSVGQSLVEFALILPVLLLMLLVGIDFGRVYLGWVNLQNLTRVAANFASEHATAWVAPQDTATIAKYRFIVANDANEMKCTLPNPIPDPEFASGTAIGATVRVGITCQFSLMTPVIASVLGGTINASAESTFPVKEGVVATVPGGGAPIIVPPVADFVGSPQSGWSPLTVTLTDLTRNNPSSWVWDFSVGGSGTGSGSSNPNTALTKGPHAVTYSCTGSPGDTCTFGVSLTASNPGGSDVERKDDYITVTVPPPTGPIADFTGTPTSGIKPLDVAFQFNDLRGGTVTYTNYQWDFTNDGTFDATGATTNHTYSAEGSYDVRLRVTDSTGAQNTLTKKAYIVVSKRICTVPDFATTKKNDAQSRWAAAGFTTTVQFAAGQGNYSIHQQTLLGGTIDPQPDGCASTITVGP